MPGGHCGARAAETLTAECSQNILKVVICRHSYCTLYIQLLNKWLSVPFTHKHTQLHIQADTVYHRFFVCLWLSNPLMFYFCHALTFEIIACPSDAHTAFTCITEQCKQHSYLLEIYETNLCVTHSTSQPCFVFIEFFILGWQITCSCHFLLLLLVAFFFHLSHNEFQRKQYL